MPPDCQRGTDVTAGIAEAAVAAGADSAPVLMESMAGALIDSARISVMAATGMLPAYTRIVLPGDEDGPPQRARLPRASDALA